MHSRLGYIAAVFVGSFCVYCAQDLMRDDGLEGDGPVTAADADIADPLTDPQSDLMSDPGADPISDPGAGDQPTDALGDLAQADAGGGGDDRDACAMCEPVILHDEILTFDLFGEHEGPILDLTGVNRVIAHIGPGACTSFSVHYRHGVAGFFRHQPTRLDASGPNSCSSGAVLMLDPFLGSEVRFDFTVQFVPPDGYTVPLTVIGFL